MKKLIYVGDPMCSWCYGFAPTMSRIYQTYKDQINMLVVVGGLYTDRSTYQDEQRITFLNQTWRRIEGLTGQKFNYSILDDQGWLYDTELSCRAVVAVRRIDTSKCFDYFHEIQVNFYLNGWDSQSEETFQKAAKSLNIDESAFLDELRNPDCVEETKNDFRISRQLGVTGFPMVLLNEGKTIDVLTAGYQPYDALEGLLRRWVEK